MYTSLLKPFFDFFFSLVGLVLLSPLIVLFIVLLWLGQGGNPFFIQIRPGYQERLFRLIKFRTMNNKRDAAGNLLPDADRLTGIGRFVRQTSLDELPQLINVLKGDMSLVGPRPLLVQYLDRYTPEQRQRHQVKPGITGWAQVNGRNTISWEEKFEYDLYYVENLNFLLDLKVLIKTINKVAHRKDVSPYNALTMDYFKGTKHSENQYHND